MPRIVVDIAGHTNDRISLRVGDTDTIALIKDRIRRRTGIPAEDLHISRMFMYADADDWSDIEAADADDPTPEDEPEQELHAIDEQEEDSASGPDAWETWYEVDPLSQRPPAGPAPPHPGAQSSSTAASSHAGASPVAPDPGATTQGTAPDAPAPGAATHGAAAAAPVPGSTIPGPHADMLLGIGDHGGPKKRHQ